MMHHAACQPRVPRRAAAHTLLAPPLHAVRAAGKTMGENLAAVPELKAGQDVVLPLDKPIKESGHIQILYGNLAPEGSVAKITGKEGLTFSGQVTCWHGAVCCVRAARACCAAACERAQGGACAACCCWGTGPRLPAACTTPLPLNAWLPVLWRVLRLRLAACRRCALTARRT